MRKLKLQVQMSVDGFVGGPNGEMDWMTWNWDDAIKQYVDDLHETVDCILLGRKMAGGFITHWTNAANNPADESYPFAQKMVNTHKVVFTHTLNASDAEVKEWKNTALATGDLAGEIQKLKNQSGGDIIVYGGAEFVASLIKANLIDEYHLFVNPAAIGKGLPVFHTLEEKRSLKLVKATPFDCGIVTLVYQPS
jgi:dihydrofolate reductase